MVCHRTDVAAIGAHRSTSPKATLHIPEPDMYTARTFNARPVMGPGHKLEAAPQPMDQETLRLAVAPPLAGPPSLASIINKAMRLWR